MTVFILILSLIFFLLFSQKDFDSLLILTHPLIEATIKLCKDSDEGIISNMMYPLADCHEKVEIVSELFIYWINKDLEFKIQHFDWAIQELAKKNNEFIEYFTRLDDGLNDVKPGCGCFIPSHYN